MPGMFASLFRLNADGKPITELPFVNALGIPQAALEGAKIIDYTGDDADNREIDMGIDADFAIIIPRSSFAQSQNHGALAYALGDAYGGFYNQSSGGLCNHRSMGSGSAMFQGFSTGSLIKLGSVGSTTTGFNVATKLYTILAVKFRGL